MLLVFSERTFVNACPPLYKIIVRLAEPKKMKPNEYCKWILTEHTKKGVLACMHAVRGSSPNTSRHINIRSSSGYQCKREFGILCTPKFVITLRKSLGTNVNHLSYLIALISISSILEHFN